MLASILFAFFAIQLSFSQTLTFDSEKHPKVPDYANSENWTALAFRQDVADILPKGEIWISDSLKEVDVFYIHPTIYLKGKRWNADVADKKINHKVDKYPVRLQASVFNATCRVYAPRYRQAIVDVFYHRSEDGDKALNLAYTDVKKAFEYFLEKYSHGRPFIIAGHSQGTHHARRLLREMIDTTELRHRMVAAYVIGFSVNDSMYDNLKMCSNSEQTGCNISWMSYKKGYYPEGWWFENAQSVNPLTWTLDTNLVEIREYRSSVVFNPKKIRSRKMSVRIKKLEGNVLWVQTKAPWFRFMKNLHVADYGLFYMDIRKNVQTRIEAYFRKKY